MRGREFGRMKYISMGERLALRWKHHGLDKKMEPYEKAQSTWLHSSMGLRYDGKRNHFYLQGVLWKWCL